MKRAIFFAYLSYLFLLGFEDAEICHRFATLLFFVAQTSAKQGVRMVARTGIEPVTQGFSVLCSTN